MKLVAISNLPFQSWELRPDTANRAVIALSAAAVQAEFAIEPGLVTLVKFSSGNKPPVKGIIDVPMKLKDLIKEMRHQVQYLLIAKHLEVIKIMSFN